jgi:hypothetical protein
MANQTDSSTGIPPQDKSRPSPSVVKPDQTPEMTGREDTRLPPAGSDAARNLERKTGPDRNRGTSQP